MNYPPSPPRSLEGRDSQPKLLTTNLTMSGIIISCIAIVFVILVMAGIVVLG